MNRPLQPALPWRAAHHDAAMRTRLALGSRVYLYPFTLIALTCLAFALRLVLLHAFPLREDEAIYGYWARAASVDPFFLRVWPDKPPLFIWLLSGAFALLGPSDAAARLVSIFASTLTIPLVALGAQRLWQSRSAALLAALLLTLNPYAVSFAPTAYTDSLLVLLGTGAIVAALSGRSLGAGLLLGAACMTKQQGVFYVPLVVALLLSYRELCHPAGVFLRWRAERSLRGDTGQWAKLGWALLGAALIILPILGWDSQRWDVAPSPWALAQRTYAPLHLLPPQQWLARWNEWAKLLGYLGGSWAAWGMLGAAIGAVTVMALTRARRHLRLLLLLGWGICFLLLHIIISVEVWDRYLLPLAPWLALVTSGALLMVLDMRLPHRGRGLLFVLLVLGMSELVYPALAAARGRMPLGGDHGDYAGLTEAIAWVEGQGCEPSAISSESMHRPCDSPAILYHQVLGWHFHFYLYDELQPQGNDPPRFDLRWFPSAAYLADNAAKSPYPPKYLIVPEWATPRDLALHLAMRGLALKARLHVGRFAVLEIVQPARPLCDWCKSSVSNSPMPHVSMPQIPVPAAP
jgi:4-amino-4-deoxy-L-arabinose transferase-like glycosyltransferase